jgi:hypothetical protein
MAEILLETLKIAMAEYDRAAKAVTSKEPLALYFDPDVRAAQDRLGVIRTKTDYFLWHQCKELRNNWKPLGNDRTIKLLEQLRDKNG